MRTICERLYRVTGQSWFFERVVSYSTNVKKIYKIMVEIRRDAYDNQSYAKASLWTNEGWVFICKKPIGECCCQNVSYTQDRVDSKLFQRDCDDLLAVATQIIS